MNQRVDIEKYLEEFRSSMPRMEGRVANLAEDNARLNRRVEAQNVEIRSLKSENASLKERLSKFEDPEPPKNSSNSSVPPSKEKMGDEIKSRTTSLREKTGKKPGGQPGHEGNTRVKLDAPDLTEVHQPNFCREYGRDLSDIEGSMEFEEESVGFRVIPETIRHRYISKRCTCG